MRIFLVLLAAFILTRTITACKSSSGPATFCDTVCLSDTLKFIKKDHPQQPSVFISAHNCLPDTISWTFNDMGRNRKVSFSSLVSGDMHINKDYISCFIRDTMYAWLKFNDCSTGRGWLIKIPYSRGEKMSVKSSALNSFDKKFAVEDGLVAYTDRGNLFAEDEATGKTAMMTFGAKSEIDYDVIHQTVDSINVSRTKFWARVKIGEEWKTFEKNVEFK